MVSYRHVRKSGDWTTQLYDMVKEKAKTTDPSGNMLSVEGEVAVEGPYGRLSIDLFNNELYETVVLIGGGIGITPCLSVWKHLLQSVSKPKKVVMVWVVREGEAAEKMYVDQFEGRVDEERELVVYENGDESIALKDDTIFEYHLYVTQKNKSQGDEKKGKAAREIRNIESGYGHTRRFNEGRLDTDKLFKGVADYVTSLPREGGGKGRVGVVVCGPFPLITGVHRSVNSSDVRGRVSVDVHEEFFSL
eukprot:gene15659-17564_t